MFAKIICFLLSFFLKGSVSCLLHSKLLLSKTSFFHLYPKYFDKGTLPANTTVEDQHSWEPNCTT